MASSLIRGKYVVAKVTSRTEAEVIPDGAVFPVVERFYDGWLDVSGV